ncbi:MAG: DUF5815 family protein [Halobacteriaceae archaeon]
MSDPRVPGSTEGKTELPCGKSIDVIQDVDMGLREYECPCGNAHAIVMDVHPLSRFIPEEIVTILQESIEPADTDAHDEFGIVHLMGMVQEEFPTKTISVDTSENSSVGYTVVWISDFSATRLHEVIIELIIELMEHAVSHGENSTAQSEFDQQIDKFEIEAFVAQYRDERDFDDKYDNPA